MACLLREEERLSYSAWLHNKTIYFLIRAAVRDLSFESF